MLRRKIAKNYLILWMENDFLSLLTSDYRKKKNKLKKDKKYMKTNTRQEPTTHDERKSFRNGFLSTSCFSSIINGWGITLANIYQNMMQKPRRWLKVAEKTLMKTKSKWKNVSKTLGFCFSFRSFVYVVGEALFILPFSAVHRTI